jgi:hypothetical protein
VHVFKLAIGAALVAGLTSACGDDPADTTSPGPDAGVPADVGGGEDTGAGVPDAGGRDAGEARDAAGDRDASGGSWPPGTVPVNFVIDDSANRSYTRDDGLAWRGTFDWSPALRELSLDPSASPPYPLLYDDGPWTEGGHEPRGATANDNIWGITGFVQVPRTSALTFEYTAISGSVMGSDGTDIWSRQSDTPGRFTVEVGATEPIDAVGLTLPAWGTIDFRVLLDTASMAPEFRRTFDPSSTQVGIESSWWGWTLQPMRDDGTRGDQAPNDGLYTFELLRNVGTGTALPHTGGLNPGDTVRFVLDLGRLGAYRGSGEGAALTAGVTAQIRADPGATWQTVQLERAGRTNDTAFTAPGR